MISLLRECHAIGLELNPAYVAMSRQRLTRELGMLAEIEVKWCPNLT